MARATLTPQDVVRSGLTPSYSSVDAANGNQFTNDGRCCVHVKNGSGSSINVTVGTPVTVDGLAVTDLVVAVGAGAEKIIGPFPPGIYNQSDGNVYVDWSSGTTVTAAVFRIP